MKWLALATLIAAGLVEVPSPVVKITSGLVEGTLGKNGRFYQFLGVPYGTVNESNRFQAPLPPPKWDGVFKAIEHSWCTQKMMEPKITIGNSDCVKLNIYVPRWAEADTPIPVMVFIHGGCYFFGNGGSYMISGEYFTEHGVIVVGINYRLNVEGFLCLGIKEAPGNAGLKDQIAALKWIKENIRAFGGDPDNVTLLGQSAGASSVSYLVLSPAAKGLFHKVILQSGSSLAPWAMQRDPIKTASTLAKKFGYNTTDPYELYDILSKISVPELLNTIKYAIGENVCAADTMFAPCIENEHADAEPVITEFPTDIISSGNYTKVPMMIGYNDKEGMYFVKEYKGNSLNNINAESIIREDVIFPSDAVKDDIIKNIQKYYFSSDKNKNIMSLLDLFSDYHFKFPAVAEAELYSKTTDQPIFYYYFKYSGYMNIIKIFAATRFIGEQGAAHGEEIFYMWKVGFLPTPQRVLERVMMNRMLSMWTNFAKYSNPIPKPSKLLPIDWLPSQESNPHALYIDKQLTIGPFWDQPSVKLWNDIYSQYRRTVKQVSPQTKRCGSDTEDWNCSDTRSQCF